MPTEMTAEEKERLEVEALIKDKQEIQERILAKAIEKKIKVLYLRHNKFNAEGRCLAIVNVEEKEAGLVCKNDYTGFDWYGMFMLHKNRLKVLEDVINKDDIFDGDYVWGYLDTDNKLHKKGITKQLIFELDYVKGTCYWYNSSKDDYVVQERASQFQICRECGIRLFDEDDMIKTENGHYYCKHCSENENIGVCDVCGKVHKRTKITLSEESLLPGRHVSDTLNICYRCIDEKFNRCENCGKLILKPNIACNDCRFSIILNYSTKPEPIFRKLKNETTKSYFGWEWEVESKHNPKDIARIANQTGNGLFYCKHDGSIRNGCEIVTHPMTYNYFRRNSKMFQEMFDKIKKAGGHSLDMDNTGVHVHISREAFDGADHMINFARCISQAIDYSEFISLRKGTRYAHYKKNSTSDIKKELEGSVSRDRYRAVNFCNRNTLEVRIYKGTISFDAILMYLQHIICCMEFSKTMTVTGRFSQDKLVDYILSKKNKSFNMLRSRTKVFKYLNSKCAIKE